jgi:hypothetical protein
VVDPPAMALSKDGSVESSVRLGKMTLVHVEVAEFLKIANSGVDLDEGFQFAHALAPRETACGLLREKS